MKTLRTRLEEDLQLQGLSPVTQEIYLSRVRRLAEHFAKSPELLSVEDLRQYFLHLRIEKKYSVQSLKSAYYSIRFLYLRTLKWKPEDFNFFRLPKEFKLPVVFTKDEIKRILSGIRISDYRLCLTMIYTCGLRLKEAVNLKPYDIDGEKRLLHIKESKGNKDRCVPLAEELIRRLRQHWKTHHNPHLLFPKRNGNRATTTQTIGKRSLQRSMLIAKREAGINKPGSIHTLRHSYATHLLDSGVNIRVIQEYLGHKSLKSTMIYTHLTTNSKELSLTKINELMADL